MANWLGEDPPPVWVDPHHRTMYRESSSQFPPYPTRNFPPSDQINNVTPPNVFTGMSHEAQIRHDKIQSLLNKTLGPEQIANRPGGGGAKLTYLEGWKAINLANEVFGYNGWFTDIKYLEADFIDYDPDTKRYSMGVTAIVRVRLQDGASHEDVGYGKLENTKSKADGLDKCKKEAVTDGLKRALRHFGKLLGNCLYDKHYLEGLARMKAPKPKFDFASVYKPDEDNVPFSHKPQSAYPAALPQQATSASTSMLPPAPPLKIDAVQAHGHPPKHPPSMVGEGEGGGAGLARAQTTGAAAGGGGRPAATNANANLRKSTTSTTPMSSRPAPRRSATISISKPNPLERTGAASALEFALNSDDESVLARMELPVGTGVGHGGEEANGNRSGRICFEGDDSGFAEECEGLKDENAPPPPAFNPPHRPLNKSSSFPSPISDIQSGHTRTSAQQQAEANKAAAMAKLQMREKAKLAAANGRAGGGGGGEQGSGVRGGMEMGLGGGEKTSHAPPNSPLQSNAAPRPGLRPAQPPSRSSSLNNLPPPAAAAAPPGPVRQAGALPTLNVGAGIIHAQVHGEGAIQQEAGGGFVSARGVKRAVGDGYDPSPPRPAGHPPGRAQTFSGSGVRQPFGELEVADGGAVKRPRA
ncbi:hypothetical protein JCM1841_000610 [Sporobolomyces salmonicolor]